jgi:hypothetical protein
MIGISELSNIIANVFDHEVRNKGRVQQQVNCPRCQERYDLSQPDGKFNLEINLSRHQFRCWKCDEETKFSGSLLYLLNTVQKYGYGTYQDILEYKNHVLVFGIATNAYADEEVIRLATLPEEIIYFKDMIPFIPEHAEAYDYLINVRNLSPETILKYNLGFCLEGKYKNRIIVPSYDRFGRINYFVARGFKKKMKPTYLNPDADKDYVIVNEKNLNFDSTIYIVEGMFDLFALPLNTTAVLGKALSSALYNALKEHKPNVVIMFDPDAFSNTISVYESIYHMYGSDHQHKVRLIELSGDNDIDEIRRHKGDDAVKQILRTARSLEENDYFKFKNNKTYKFSYVNEPRGYGFGQLYYQ